MPTAHPESVTAAKQQRPHADKVPKWILSYTGTFLNLEVATYKTGTFYPLLYINSSMVSFYFPKLYLV